MSSITFFFLIVTQKSVSEVWEPLPVTDALADFLALGSRLRGEVRITSALLNLRNLRPASLNRLPVSGSPGADFLSFYLRWICIHVKPNLVLSFTR